MIYSASKVDRFYEFKDSLRIFNDDFSLSHDKTIDLAFKYLSDNSIKIAYPLDERETFILRQRLGINEEQLPKTLEEIASMMYSLSRERVRQLESRAMRKIGYRIRNLNAVFNMLDDELPEVIQKIVFADPNFQSFDYYLSLLSEGDKQIYLKTKDKVLECPPSMNIDFLELSVRTSNSLKRAGILEVNELLSKSKMELATIAGLGEKGYSEVLDSLNSWGYKLCEVVPIEVVEDTQIRELMKKGLIGNRTGNALLRANINSIDELLSKSYHEIKNIWYLGEKGYSEVFDFLYAHGYTLKSVSESETSVLSREDVPLVELAKLGIIGTLVCNTLLRAGKKTAKDVLAITYDELKDIHRFGPLRYQELIAKMNSLGFGSVDKVEDGVITDSTKNENASQKVKKLGRKNKITGSN